MSERRNEIEVAFVRSVRCLELEVPEAVYADFAEKCRDYMGNLAEAYRERDALAVRVETLETALRGIAALERRDQHLLHPIADGGHVEIIPRWTQSGLIARAALAGLSVGPADDKETT
jgi:hypothetical protein